jgi:tetratricopeptide (TPR) repeat protein
VRGERPRRPGWLFAVSFLCIAAAAAAEEAASTVSAEEAADFARRAALSALHGPQKIFLESIDADGILRRLLGAQVWGGLTRRQQDILRATVRDHFAEAFSSVSGASSEVRWAWVPHAAESPVSVYMGLHYGTAVLKTRWIVSRTPRGWAIQDVVLVDPGLSLASEVGRLLGPRPVLLRDRAREARARALPRLLGLLAVVAVALIFARRLPRERRPLLWVTAAVPTVLFLIDGALAVHRALKEPYALVEVLPPQRWRELEKVAMKEQREGNGEAARAAWEKAIELGAPRAPVYYQLGTSARAGGDTAEAKPYFERALAEQPPAPGAGKELALIALAEGRHADARALLENYLRATGPDPDTLATLAVVETNLGDTAAAVKAIESARALVGESWKKAELEAQVYARSGNAPATVAALRPLEGQGRLDRSALRADPAFLAIATAPQWVAFLAEPPSPPATPAPGRAR